MKSDLIELLEEKASEAPLVGYFGYGSLVNENTLRTKYIATIPATLNGWQRMWDIPVNNDFDGETVSLLTVRPNQTNATKGVVVFDWADNLPMVDAREHNYRRHNIHHSNLETTQAFEHLNIDLFVYEATENTAVSEPRPPLLHSYLDAVLQGFHNLYGAEGVHEFMETTGNFHTPILDDRMAPKYPRSVDLTEEQRNLIDLILESRADISFIR